MAKGRISPYNIAATEALAKDPPTVRPEPITSDADAMEAKAREQYAEACRGYFPGFAFSNLPANFVVRLKLNTEGRARAKERGKDPRTFSAVVVLSAWNLTKDVRRWENIREHLLDYPDSYAVPIVPKGWSYAALVGNAKPHRFDLKNPRLYTLEGRMVPWDAPNHKVWTGTYMQPKGHFVTVLLEVFTQAAPNDQAAEVVAFLEHHRTRGANPEALADHVKELLETWKAEPPTRIDLHRPPFEPKPIPRHRILIRAMEQWLEAARNAPTSAKGTANAKAMPTAAIRLRTLAERLAALPGAREAFDTMLFIDGYTTEAGEWKLASRKGRAEVVAAWDAVVEIFGVEGYAKEEKSDKALSAALREYIPGFTISERPNKLRITSNGSTYTKARASCERYLKERRELIIAERSDTSE
jgi:hypothetical protein